MSENNDRSIAYLDERVTVGQKVSFGIAGAGVGLLSGIINGPLSVFYTFKLGLEPGKVAIAMLIFAIWDGGARATRISIDNSFNSEWHHVVGTYDGSVLKQYVDGKLEGEASHEGSIDRNEWNVNIGKNPANNTQYLNGGIDEVRIYDRALTQEEVAWLAGITKPFDKPF